MKLQLKKNVLISKMINDKNIISQFIIKKIMRLFKKIRFDKNKKSFIAMNINEKFDFIFK